MQGIVENFDRHGAHPLKKQVIWIDSEPELGIQIEVIHMAKWCNIADLTAALAAAKLNAEDTPAAELTVPDVGEDEMIPMTSPFKV